MDHDRFDALTRSLSSGASRRRLLSSLTGGLVAGLAIGQAESVESLARKKLRGEGKQTGAKAEDQLSIGSRCDPPKHKHGKRHGCNDCRTGFSVAYTNAKGKTVRKCACKPVGQPSTSNEAWQCCSGLSDGRQCVSPPGPPGPSGAAGPPGPPPVCPAVCPVCQTCNPATSRCEVDTTRNNQAGTACPAPNVCCTGTCCNGVPHGVRACNAAGGCGTCAEVCPENCLYCFNLADGGTVCGSGSINPCVPCSSAADCTDPAFPYCVESFTIRADNERRVQCDIGTACTAIVPCT